MFEDLQKTTVNLETSHTCSCVPQSHRIEHRFAAANEDHLLKFSMIDLHQYSQDVGNAKLAVQDCYT